MERARRRRDDGYTLVEILIVVVVLGIVSSVVTLSVRGLTDRSDDSVCDIDHRALTAAIEVYTTQNETTTVPGASAADRMAELIDANLLRSGSVHFEVNSDGSLTGVGACA